MTITTAVPSMSKWLEAWQLTKALDKAFGIPEPPDLEAPDTCVYTDADKPLAEGQVRILRSKYVLRDDYVPMVLLLPWVDGWWLAMPFAPPPFSVPALAGEMNTGSIDDHLKVLQVWNTRSAPTKILLDSWVYGDPMPPAIVQGARQLFGHLVGGQQLPADFPFERGPGLPPETPADDPRRAYLKLFRGQFDPLTNDTMEI